MNDMLYDENANYMNKENCFFIVCAAKDLCKAIIKQQAGAFLHQILDVLTNRCCLGVPFIENGGIMNASFCC